MITFELGVEDLADTRFALSPLYETVLSLRVLREPGLSAIHLPWRRAVLRGDLGGTGDAGGLGGVGGVGGLRPGDVELLMSLMPVRRTLPDFLTPRPARFDGSFEEELAVVARTPPAVVRRDLLAAHAPDPLPAPLEDALGDNAAVAGLRDALCAALRRYWEAAVRPVWPRMRLVLEADMTYRARQLALGGARLLFADMHPNLRWKDGVLHVGQMISRHHVQASGRGLLLVPSVFAHKPAPPVDPDGPPALAYPSRGAATLWESAPVVTPPALASLLGAPRARLLGLLEEPLATVTVAGRLGVTPSAVSQHLRVLNATGLVTRTRDGRHVLYRRSPLGDLLLDGCGPTAL
ncbi:winged helix-turn-helix domain-containing protein [Streptomyces sp. A0592]|uniref:ArsR/SmtB family transcription factor n=1 Tax=Streptomyces sp. A0592 TaxID=2563099 RepID=UPI00109E7A1A|nr:winged helix-turn-helix domain-containing protein [Streptomyces sp. A0592]THA77305.1 ArsR family transcriptional regulator [Streptomyces sp. A0592]